MSAEIDSIIKRLDEELDAWSNSSPEAAHPAAETMVPFLALGVRAICALASELAALRMLAEDDAAVCSPEDCNLPHHHPAERR